MKPIKQEIPDNATVMSVDEAVAHGEMILRQYFDEADSDLSRAKISLRLALHGPLTRWTKEATNTYTPADMLISITDHLGSFLAECVVNTVVNGTEELAIQALVGQIQSVARQYIQASKVAGAGELIAVRKKDS